MRWRGKLTLTANQQRAAEGRFLTAAATLSRDQNLLHVIFGKTAKEIEDKNFFIAQGGFQK